MRYCLKERRKELLDTIHADQKALDSLDYLISDRKKDGNKRWKSGFYVYLSYWQYS